MDLQWKNVSSTVQPLSKELTSNNEKIFIRQNIQLDSSKEVPMYTYQEACLTLLEYQLYLLDVLDIKISNL